METHRIRLELISIQSVHLVRAGVLSNAPLTSHSTLSMYDTELG